MNFIKVGQHCINLNNINYTARDSKKLVVFLRVGGDTVGERNGSLLDLFNSDADEFERKLQNSCG